MFIQVKKTKRQPGASEETLLETLGPGDFIGEQALDSWVSLRSFYFSEKSDGQCDVDVTATAAHRDLEY